MDTLSVNTSREVSLAIDLKKLLTGEDESSNDWKSSALTQLVKLGLGDAQALSTIDYLMNTQLKLTMSPNGNVTVAVEQFNQFILFPKLPPELRTKIWALASSEPRIVEIEVATQYRCRSPDYLFIPRTPIPAVLQVSIEARKEALKHYTRTFQRPRYSRLEHLPNYSTYMNLEQDTAYVFPNQQFPNQQQTQSSVEWTMFMDCLTRHRDLYAEISASIRRIAVPMPLHKHLAAYGFALAEYKGLREVVLVYGQENQGPMNVRCPSDRGKLRFSDPLYVEKAAYETLVKQLRVIVDWVRTDRRLYNALPPLISCKHLTRI